MRHARIYAGAVAVVLAAMAACRTDAPRDVTAPSLVPGDAPQLYLTNPTPGNPFTQCGNIGTFCTWEFGNINQSKALMHEGDATPFRQVINDDPNAASSSDGAPSTLYEVQIQYKTRHGGKNAYDFITRWDVSEGSEFHPLTNPDGSSRVKANLCIPPNGEAATSNLCTAAGSGGSLAGADVTFIEIPVPFADPDPKATNVGLSTHSAPTTRVVTVFNAKAGAGGTDIQVPAGYSPTLTYSGGELDAAQYGILTFRFKTGSHPQAGNFLIAWGGHVAQQSVWGEGTGAANVSGSPYHMQVNYIKRLNADGTNCGSQCVLLSGSRDLQMAANVIQAAPALRLTKTPNVTQVCTGFNTQVTYTYVVTNSGNVPISGTIRDDNGTPGNTADDFEVGTFTDLAVNASATRTATRTITGTTTNIATASITGTSVSTTATATVTGVACSIAVTKTPNKLSVCSQSGAVTYDYVVTNTSDVQLTGVTLNDDKLGPITLSATTLASGATATGSASTTLTATTTNTATATGTAFAGSVAEQSVTAQQSATVNVVDCKLEITKTPDKLTICDGVSTVVTYTYVITNSGDAEVTDLALTDDKLGAVTLPVSSLAAGGTTTATKAGTLTQTTTNVATVTGNALGGTVSSTPVSAQGTSTVVAQQCGRGQIAPTQTTCEQFRDGTSASEPFLAAQLRSGAISQVNPGVIFYYGTVTVPAGGNQTLTVTQTDVPKTGAPLPLMQVAGDNQAELYNTSCVRVAFFTLSNFQPTALSVAPGSYIVRIKYAPNSLVGATAAHNQFPVNYRWEMALNGGLAFSQANVDLTLK